MNRLDLKRQNLLRRKNRIRQNLDGDAKRPRLSIFVSNQNITAQLIDDQKMTTLLQVTTVGNTKATGSLTEKAAWVGTETAKQAKAKKIAKVTLDRNGRAYHGRIKALAEAARAGGLEL